MRSLVPWMAALGALVMAAPAQATFTQEPGSPYAVGTAPFGVVSADFDASGRPDVAAINGTSSNLSVLLRQTAGGFAQEPGSPFTTGGGPNFGSVADFNGDGRPDVAVAAFTGQIASIMLRQPGGGFAAEANPPGPGGRASAVTAADFNGDGLPDVAIAAWDLGTISVFLRQAGGGFAAEGSAIAVGPNPRYLVASDFNGDGRPDLAVSNQGNGTVTVLLRQAGTGFAAEPPITVGTTPAGMLASDFNGDGRPDLAVTNYATSSVSVLLRQAGGGFAEEAGSPIPVATGPLGLAGADFNGDGRPDLAVTSNVAGNVTVLLRQAGGGFAADADSPIAVPNAYGAVAADFDGDGRPDLAVSNDGPGTVTVLLNASPVPPPAAPPTPPVPGRSAVVRVVSGTVLIKLPGKGFVPLTGAANIPMGSQLDTRKGRVTITSAADTGGKKTQSADFYDGIFQVKQTLPRKKPRKPTALVTDLVMKGQIARSQCAPLKGARGAATNKKKGPKAVLGQLWGNGKGKFRTSGKYSSATVRGTIWLVQDRCEGTLTKVKRGTVSVRDFKRKKTVSVKAGHSYLARAQRAATKTKR